MNIEMVPFYSPAILVCIHTLYSTKTCGNCEFDEVFRKSIYRTMTSAYASEQVIKHISDCY